MLGFVYLAILASTGCVQVVDKDEKSNSGQNSPQNQATVSSESIPYNEWVIETEFYRVRAVPAKPNQYLLQLLSGSSLVEVIQPKIATPTAMVTDDRSINYPIPGGAKVSIKIAGKLTEVVIPQDREINETLVGSSEPEMKVQVSGRIFLGPRANLISREKKLILIAREIISDRAILQNFISTDQASTNVDGLTGGQVMLVAMKVSGLLYVEMRGQNGGIGNSGADYAGGTGIENLIRGGAGGRGRNGGHTGNFILITQNNEELDLNIDYIPGLAGEGGLGGRGQPAYMEPAKFGPTGITGEKGKEGKKGFFCRANSPDQVPNCKSMVE